VQAACRVSLVALGALAELCVDQWLDLPSLWEPLTAATRFPTDHWRSQNSSAKVKLNSRLLKPRVSKLRPVSRNDCQVSEITAVGDNDLLPVVPSNNDIPSSKFRGVSNSVVSLFI